MTVLALPLRDTFSETPILCALTLIVPRDRSGAGARRLMKINTARPLKAKP
jgi:hypothetical protein